MALRALSHIGIAAHSLDGGFSLLRLSGVLDIHTGPCLERALLALHDDGQHRLALDFDHVRYMDSAGLGVLLAARQRAQARKGRLMLVCRCVRVQRLFTITGLTRVFDIFESEDALRHRLNGGL